MNQTVGWMGGQLWIWVALAVLVVFVVVFKKLLRK